MLLLGALSALSQPTGGIKGTIINRATREGLPGATLQLSCSGQQLSRASTAQDGGFLFEGLSDGTYEISVQAPDFISTSLNVIVEKGFVRDLMKVGLTPDKVVVETDDASFSEFDMEDSGYSNSPTILSGSADPFNSVASFGFSSVRFRPRGFDASTQEVYLMGIKMNDALTGNSPYSLWSGLNEATRSKDSVDGLGESDIAVGGFNGITNIYADAPSVRKGWRFSALTNSALYRLRLMGSYASGPLDSGWSYAFNFSARLGGNDWIKGVYYRNFAYYASVQKEFSDVHKLSLTTFGAPGQRGAQNASTQETYDLVGSNTYNSNWGYQDGRVRNARVRKTFEPVTVLKYSCTPSDRLETAATLLFRTGWNGYTALDWFNAADPRPDYYRNLPSYFFMEEDGDDYNKQAKEKYGWATEMWTGNASAQNNYTHVDWDRMYNINAGSRDKWASGARSHYVQEERHVDQNDLNLALQARWMPKSTVAIAGGLNGKLNRTEYYKKIADLLGGDYYVNINNFAERDFSSTPYKIQQDLDYYVAHNDTPELLGKGSKYGYDYYAHVRKADAWATGTVSVGGLKAMLGGEIGVSSFWREGLYRNGLFAGYKEGSTTEPYTYKGVDISVRDSDGNIVTSKGNSAQATFLTWRAKLAAEYSLRGGHTFSLSAGYFGDAPSFERAFLSPRTRNTLIPNLTTVKTFSADATYKYSAGGYSVRLTAFYADVRDKTDVMSFYDDTQSSFTNLAMWGIGERHMGLELGFALPLPVDGLTLKGAACWGNYVYTTTPYMTQTIDNSAELVAQNVPVTYWQGTPSFKLLSDGSCEKDINGNLLETGRTAHHVAGTPELATSISINYRTKSYWFFTVEGQYFADSYLSMNPLYRTTAACAGPTGKNLTAESVTYMTAQEKFDPAFLLNASIGKSWYLHYKYNFGFSLSLNNLTNNCGVKTGGYEQTRLVKGSTSYLRFDPKYFYMTGFNYMLNLYFRF